MNRIAYFLILMLAFGCAKEHPKADGPSRNGTVLKATLSPLSKTAVDGVKISWTQGDVICVNGKQSAPLTAAATHAEFSFSEELSSPYKAVYPHSLYKNEGTVCLPSVWSSFQVPLYGFVESGDEIGFRSLTCIIKLTVTDQQQRTLSYVDLKPLGGEQVCGDFALNYTTGALTGTSSAEGDKTVRVMVGKELSGTPVTVYIPVPAGTYTHGYNIEFVSKDNKVMRCLVDARTLSAGELRTMPEVEFVPNVDVEDVNGIRNADDFLAFAAAVNAGESTQEWENEEGWVTLLNDIDFFGVNSWTPVGNVVAPWGSSFNPALPEGQHAFTGKFDGNAHHIRNLALVDNVTEEGRHFGLFGYVGPGGVVQNFVIDASCSLSVTSSVSHSAGMIAGVLYDATVRDVTSYAPMTYTGAVPGYFHMALIGGLYALEAGCIVDSVHNNGAIEAVNSVNLNGGATGLHIAGIAGFTNASTGHNVISSSNNYGKITSQAGRTAGILGAANKNTTVTGCENHGNQLNTMPKNDGGRLGNICCFTNNNSVITGCKNYGNLVSTTSGRVGGIISLPNAGVYQDNENYGEIISDSQYRGVLFGYLSGEVAWKGGVASGKVGSYNSGTYIYDLYPEEDKLNYLGKDGSSEKATYTDIDIEMETSGSVTALDVEADFRIFFIGNSFTKDAVEHLPGILNAAGLDKIQMIHMYYGGRTIPEYNSGWTTSTDYHCYVCNPGQPRWSEVTGKSLAQIAAIGKFDVVTIQEHTGRRLAWGWTDDEKAAVQGLVNKVKEAQNANGASPKLFYILSQAYHDLSKAQSGSKPFTTTEGMWEVIAAQGKKVVEECGFDGVISTGAMLQNLRTSSLNNANGLTRDGYHMDYGISRYGASCVVFETAIGPFNGNLTMDDNTYRTTKESTTDGTWTTAITDARAPIALQAARHAMEHPYDVVDMQQ